MEDTLPDASWLPDPEQPDRLRYWDGGQWTDHVSIEGVQSVDPIVKYNGTRWQYAVVNLGAFNTMDRMEFVLGAAGSQGWELIHVYDKSSNWHQGLEKGFMLLKRPVDRDTLVSDDQWCITLSLAGGKLSR